MSALSENNFSMSAEKYLAKHNILRYLEDSITQLLEHREENPKVVPAKFLCEYFCSLRDGNHTMFREFAFIRSTPHNRASFVVLFWKSFRQIGKKGDLLSIQEYHSLLGLLCPDFPFQLVQKTARIVLIDDALDCLISFSDFVYAFQVQLYFEEFLEKCMEIYQGLIQTYHSPRDPVIVPTSGANDAKVHQNVHLPPDGVDAMQFFRALYPILERVEYSTPHLSSLKEILFNIPRISFYEFLMAVAKSESINSTIGRLPPKSELLEGADIELTSLSGVSTPCQLHFSTKDSTPNTNMHNKHRTPRKSFESPRPPLKGPGGSGSRPSSSTQRGSVTSNVNNSSSNTAAALGNSQQSHGRMRHSHGQKKGIVRRQPVAATDSESDTDSSTDSSDT